MPAEARLAAAREAERRQRRDVEMPGSGTPWGEVSAAQRESRLAQQWLDTLQRSAAALPTAIAEARRDLVRAESEMAAVEAQARQMLARARK
jgi:hypothetical protein